MDIGKKSLHIKKRNELKNKFGNVLLIVYIFLSLTLTLSKSTSGFTLVDIITICGAMIGFGFKIALVIVFWQTVMKKYINANQRVSVIQLALAIFLIMLALAPVGASAGFIESFIVISIVMILKNDYSLFSRKNHG